MIDQAELRHGLLQALVREQILRDRHGAGTQWMQAPTRPDNPDATFVTAFAFMRANPAKSY